MFASTTTLTLAAALVLGYVVGIPTAVVAVVRSRTSEGAVAWAISLITLPWFAVPLYWIFGRDRFRGYRRIRRLRDHEVCSVHKAGEAAEAERGSDTAIFEVLARRRFTTGNRTRLLIDGEETFRTLLAAIDGARKRLLIQFFIVRDDEIGRRFLKHLAAKAREGVEIRFLYDEVGSHALPTPVIDHARESGIDLQPFHSTRRSRFQLNFRNHRKVLVADGKTAYVGGHNLGEEYLGRSEQLGAWRDTHLELEGPAACDVELAFLEDWHWATGTILEPSARGTGSGPNRVLIFPSGPADTREWLSLLFVHLIHSARSRLWLATPYFVPDRAVLRALELAGLRGVDVRLLLPTTIDHRLVALSSLWFLHRLQGTGVRVFRLHSGFMHQKVLLVDDQWASVGSANLDNRSLRLNFEITAMTEGEDFAGEVAEMLTDDFSRSNEVGATELIERSSGTRWAAHLARLLAPIQ